MSDEKGLGPYAAGAGKPNRIFAKLQAKCRLKAELAQIQAEIDTMIPTLSHGELAELQSLMASEVAAAGADAEALRAQIEKEAALAKTQRPMQITIPRRASAILGAEAERRITRGVYPSAESLVGEAISRAFAGVRP
jgi:hypothetical protein